MSTVKTAVETKEVKVVTVKESEWITVKNCLIKSVTSKESIADIAAQQGINAGEVFVRITFEYKGAEYKASQKLRILGKDNYQKLMDLAKADNDTRIDLDVSDTEFFRIHKEVSLDDLFKDIDTSRKDSRNSVSKLFSR